MTTWNERQPSPEDAGPPQHRKAKRKSKCRGTTIVSFEEVEVSVSNLTPGVTYTVFIDAKQVGTFTTNKSGKAEMELTTPSVK